MNPDPTSLDRLHDVLAPPAAPWWPPAPGWIVLGCFLAIFFLILIARAIHAWQQNRYRRDALRELRRIRQATVNSNASGNVPASIAGVLKRTALTIWPHEKVASLTGPAWWRFLDRACEAQGFADNVGPTLDRAVYDDLFAATLPNDQVDRLFAAAEFWVEHHDRELAQC
jgi:hypothetical protein